MARRLLPLVVLLLCIGGCVGHDRLNPDCAWTGDRARPLDLNTRADRDHLIDDAQLGEELAIRHADALFGRAFARPQPYARARDACMARLFDDIARRHRVPAALVRESVERTRLDFAAAAFASFGLLFAFASRALVRVIIRRFREERVLALAVIFVSSLVLGAAGVLAGDPWWGMSQDLRLGTTHASYRAFRSPWRRHPVALLVAGVALVWLVTPLAWKGRGSDETSAVEDENGAAGDNERTQSN